MAAETPMIVSHVAQQPMKQEQKSNNESEQSHHGVADISSFVPLRLWSASTSMKCVESASFTTRSH